MIFCYEIALWVSGEYEIVGRTHSLSVQHCRRRIQLIISSRSVQETAVAYICKFFEGLLRHPVLTPKTVGVALVQVFAVILPVEKTTPLVDAPPDIGSEYGVCNI